MALLEIKSITKTFKGECVLDNVSYAFPSTGLVCITGVSGSGKSTLLKCIMGIIKCDKGEIYYRNKRVKDFNSFRNESISYIFQNYSLISFLSPSDNININNRSLKKEDVIRCAEKVNISHKIKQDIKTLSGGEKQRIAIARALISNSPIIICDEPTGSLDKNNANEIMELLKEISKEKLVIVVTHNMEHVSTYSDVILKLQKGKIEEYVINENKNINKTENKKFYLPLKNTLKLSASIFISQLRKIMFSIISLGLSLSFLLLAVNTYSSVNKMIGDNITSFMNYNFMRLSLIKETKLENSNFSLVKNVRPETSDLVLLNDLLVNQKIQYDLTPLVPTYPKIYKTTNKNKYIDKIEFVPFFLSMYDKMENKIDGQKPKNFNEVIINERALEILEQKNFYLDLSLSIDYKTKNNSVITDNIYKEMKMNIVGTCKEFSLIETPRIYYAYDFLEGISKSIHLNNLSSYFQEDLSLYDRLSIYTYDNDPFISYSYVIESSDINEVMNTYKKINSTRFDDKHFALENTSLELVSSFQSVFESIYEVVTIFIAITMIISLLLLGLSLDSIVNDNKIDIGIMMCIGILKCDIKMIYIIVSLMVGISGTLISFFFYRIFSSLINLTLLKDIVLINIPEKLLLRNALLGIIVMGVLTLISSLTSFIRIDKMQIGEIMREE